MPHCSPARCRAHGCAVMHRACLSSVASAVELSASRPQRPHCPLTAVPSAAALAAPAAGCAVTAADPPPLGHAAQHVALERGMDAPVRFHCSCKWHLPHGCGPCRGCNAATLGGRSWQCGAGRSATDTGVNGSMRSRPHVRAPETKLKNWRARTGNWRMGLDGGTGEVRTTIVAIGPANPS